MKVYHVGNRSNFGDVQAIFVASDGSEGIDHLKGLLAHITIKKDQKTIEVLVPKDWTVRQFAKRDDSAWP